jgi:hypothetical protein
MEGPNIAHNAIILRAFFAVLEKVRLRFKFLSLFGIGAIPESPGYSDFAGRWTVDNRRDPKVTDLYCLLRKPASETPWSPVSIRMLASSGHAWIAESDASTPAPCC